MSKTWSGISLVGAVTVATVLLAIAGCTKSTTLPPLVGNPPPPLPVAPAALVVANGDNHVLFFPFGGTGTQNETPSNSFTSSAFFSTIFDVARDARGNIFVTDLGNSQILIFDETATGDTTPAAVVNEPVNPNPCGTTVTTGLAVTSDNSSVYGSDFGCGVINFFGPLGPTGGVAPLTTISGTNTLLCRPNHLALDASNDLFVNDGGGCGGIDSGKAHILKFTAGASGNATPVKNLTLASGVNSFGLALDSSNDMFTTTNNLITSTVLEFAASANGAAVATKTWTFAINRGINELKVDSTFVYFTDANNNSVCWFPISHLSGVVTPTSCIHGTNTTLSGPIGLSF